jgi:hypothetical protein
MERIQDTLPDPGAMGRRTLDPDARLSLVTGIVIAAGFLFLLFFAAIKHNAIADAHGVITIAALGFVCGLATIITGQVLKTPVRHWAQAGIGAVVLILSVSLSWHGTSALGNFITDLTNLYRETMAGQTPDPQTLQRMQWAFQQAAPSNPSFYNEPPPEVLQSIQQAVQQAAQQVSKSPTDRLQITINVLMKLLRSTSIVPQELFVLYGSRSGAWACVFVLMVVALGCLEARRRVPESGLVRYLLAGVVGIAWIACLVQLLVWLVQSGSDSPVWMFRSHDTLLIIQAILAVLGVLAILSVELAASISIIRSSIENLARTGLVLAWVLIWLVIGMTVIRFLLGLGGGATGWLATMFVVGLVTGFAPLLAAGVLAISGIQNALVAVTGSATTAAVQPPLPRPVPVAERPPGPMPPLAVAQQPIPKAPPVIPKVPPVETPHVPSNGQQAPNPEPATDDIEDQLRKLKTWQEKGLIAEAEYQSKKQELLGRL